MKNVESCIRSNLKRKSSWPRKSLSILRLKNKMTSLHKRSLRKVRRKRLNPQQPQLRKKEKIMSKDGKNRKRNKNGRGMKMAEKRRRQKIKRRKKREMMMNTGRKRVKMEVGMLKRQRRKKRLLEGRIMVMKSIDYNLILNGT